MMFNDEFNRRTARIAGILFLVQLIPYYFGHDFILGSILSTSNYLAAVYSGEHQISLVILLELTSAFAFVGVAAILFQIVKSYHPTIALSYIGLRFVEFGMIVLSDVKLMSLVTTARQFAKADAEDTSFVQAIGDSVLAEWEWATLIYMIVFCVNALLFYYLLFSTRLVPGFISIWGFLGAIVALTTPILMMFERSSGGMLAYVPIGFNELFLAIWLIVRGFNPMEIQPSASE